MASSSQQAKLPFTQRLFSVSAWGYEEKYKHKICINREIAYIRDHWINPTCRPRNELRAMLKVDSHKWHIRKAVLLGLGSLVSADETLRRRATTQLCIFLDLCVTVQKRGQNPPIQLYAQDPSFTEFDKEYLRGLNINILELTDDNYEGLGPAKEHMGPDTLLCEFDVWDMMAMDPWPAMAHDLVHAETGLRLGMGLVWYESRFKDGADKLAFKRLYETHKGSFPDLPGPAPAQDELPPLEMWWSWVH